jgi:hypothetical protein
MAGSEVTRDEALILHCAAFPVPKPQVSSVMYTRQSVTTLLPRTRDCPGPKRVVKCHRESSDPGRNPAEARAVARVLGYAQGRFRRTLLLLYLALALIGIVVVAVSIAVMHM